jgi:DNA-binding transcriptional regulator YiaG
MPAPKKQTATKTPAKATRAAATSVRARVQNEANVDPLRVKIRAVTEAFGSQSRAAEFLGVARSQPGRWLSGQERPNPEARRLIRDFDYVWDRLTDIRSPAAAHIWLTSANAFLNFATPLAWLKTRGPEGVIATIDAEEAGSYA